MTTANVPLTARRLRSDHPEVRQIGIADLIDAIAKGFSDFNAMPTHFFYLAIIYPVVTFGIVGVYGELDLLPFIFPLLAGYTLLGPLAAIGTYELSRRREFGRFTGRTNAFLVFKSHSINAIVNLGVLLTIIYFIWVFAFAKTLLTTPEGIAMIITGCSVGFVFAVVVLSFSVVSFPMLLDLDVGVIVAVKTSVRAVIVNPVIMAIWGITVAGSLVVGSLPFFVGLCVVLPVIGHITWHLYRKIVES